jgi:hypothetical protein
VAPELQALGFEKPEQIGALFIDDGPGLRELCRDTPPLTDDFPRRLSSRPNTHGDESQYHELMAIEQAQKRFENSAHIKRLWPDELRLGSIPFFAYRHVLNNLHLHSPRFYSGPQRHDYESLHEVLTESSLTTLPLWMLSSSVQEQRIIEGLSPGERTSAAVDNALGDRALARRDYLTAAARYRRGFERDPLRFGLALREIFALSIGGPRSTPSFPPTKGWTASGSSSPRLSRSRSPRTRIEASERWPLNSPQRAPPRSTAILI